VRFPQRSRHAKDERGTVQQMLKKAAVILFAVGIVGHLSAQGRDLLAKFEGGIGVIPVANGADHGLSPRR
jgi:hypothetical protein